MGFLDILCYIGVGLGVAGLLILISYLWSRSKTTVLYEDGSARHLRGRGDWGLAYFFSILIMAVITVLLLYNLAHFSLLKSIGLGILGAIVMFFIIFGIVYPFCKKAKTQDFAMAIVGCILDGAGFAILAVVWGWF